MKDSFFKSVKNFFNSKPANNTLPNVPKEFTKATAPRVSLLVSRLSVLEDMITVLTKGTNNSNR